MSRADESRAGATATAIILSPAVAAVAVALRVYTRRFLVGVRFSEDYWIVCAMVFSVAMSVIMGMSVVYGFGRHIETVSSAELVEQGKLSVPCVILYILTHMALKLSILLQYVRISVMAFEERLCYAIIVVLIVQSLAMVGIHLGLCRPLYALWTANVQGAVCLDRKTVLCAQLGMTIAMDFLVLVAPVFILRHLSLPWIQRFAILIALSFGGIACIISVFRLLVVIEFTQSKDGTYDKVFSAVYGVIEPNLGIFCACIVTLKPLFNRYAPQTSQRLGLTDGNDHGRAGRGNGGATTTTTTRPWPVFGRRPALFTGPPESDDDKSLTVLSGATVLPSDMDSSASAKTGDRGDQSEPAKESVTAAAWERESDQPRSRRGSQSC